jgi:uncharacterized protein (TIGR03083 family)
MVAAAPDRDGVCLTLDRESRRVARMMRGCADLRRPVPGLAWTTGQLAAHLAAVYRASAATIRGEHTGLDLGGATGQTLPERTAAANAHMVAAIRPGSPAEAAGALAEGAADLLTTLTGRDLAASHPVPWYGPGVTRTAGTLAALAVSETLVHGYDLARATGNGRRVPAGPAAMVAAAVLSEMMPLLLDPRRAAGFTGVFEFRIRGGQRFVLRIGGGKAWAEPGAGQPADCVMSLSGPAALLVAMGRQPVWRAVVTGGALACGRRPWLGLRVRSLFMNP